MWQRFTDRARKVIFYAQEEAQQLGENLVSTEHLLLGLIRETDSVAARVLEQMGISLFRIRQEVDQVVPRGEVRWGQEMLLSPRGKRVIDLAYDEARRLNNNYIGTEHLLLGLIREGEGLAARILVRLGVSLERTREVVRHLQDPERATSLTQPTPPEQPESQPPASVGTAVEREAELLQAATEARKQAYAPYSKYRVGAAVLGEDGAIYSGCNVENASYGLTVCAERVAIWNAVVGGVRQIKAMALITQDGSTPCGACRQVMMEFVQDPQPFLIAVADEKGNIVRYRLSDLLPKPFHP